jgi:nucleotide-binding universal stress UspA family protein
MVRSILVGLDGSAYSRSAMELGIRWAKRFDAFLVGLSIVDEPTICEPEPVPLGAGHFKESADRIRLKRATRQVEALLEEFALKCGEAGVASKLLEDVGEPHERILLESQRYDLILLGQKTFFHFATQEGPCDTLKKVLKNTPRPVITAPEKPGAGDAVIVAYDGSLQAARALFTFRASGLSQLGKVHVLSIDADHDKAVRDAGRAEEFLRFHDIEAQVNTLTTSAAPATVLLEQAEKLHAGLVVMGAYGQSTLREFFLGSVTRTMLEDSPVPLFLYH